MNDLEGLPPNNITFVVGGALRPDAEGSFIISSSRSGTSLGDGPAKNQYFKFIFRIRLHIDDKAVLPAGTPEVPKGPPGEELIHKTLQVGKVSVDLKTFKAI